jgi:alpha-amylase
MKNFRVFVFLAIFLTACSPTPMAPSTAVPGTPVQTATSFPTATSIPTPVQQTSWWQQAIFYEIFVRSFNDSNADGIGDFNGITEKLDYLKNLGVTALWLMPIQQSPSYHGYDVINYFFVNPDYGTMEDFKRLLDEAHQRGMHIIIDLVLNHTSNQNPIFMEANNNPQSPYREWFLWSSSDPGTIGLNGSAWHAGKSGYYYGIFGGGMPDFNYTNPEVTTFMKKVVHYWLTNVGLDGFRLDAVKYIIEDGTKLENTSLTHEWLRNFYTSYKIDKSDAYTVGEIYGAGAFLAKTYTGDQMDQVFNFEMASGFVNSAAGGATSGINSAISFMLKDMPDGQFATFLTNHDQNRVMSTLNGNVNQAKIAAALMLTAPGTPYIYYGEEIGMQGKKPDEDIRLPMQWSAEVNAGFSTATPWRAPATDYSRVNVAAELGDPNSLLRFYQELIAIRHQNSAIQNGAISLVTSGNTGIYSILRSDESEKILVLINLTKLTINDYSLSIQNADLQDGPVRLEALFGNGTFTSLNVTNHGFDNFKPLDELQPYSIYILKLIQ